MFVMINPFVQELNFVITLWGSLYSPSSGSTGILTNHFQGEWIIAAAGLWWGTVLTFHWKSQSIDHPTAVTSYKDYILIHKCLVTPTLFNLWWHQHYVIFGGTNIMLSLVTPTLCYICWHQHYVIFGGTNQGSITAMALTDKLKSHEQILTEIRYN